MNMSEYITSSVSETMQAWEAAGNTRMFTFGTMLQARLVAFPHARLREWVRTVTFRRTRLRQCSSTFKVLISIARSSMDILQYMLSEQHEV